MIVHRDATSLRLITQPDHAALSGELMRRWVADGFQESPRLDDILLAIREHDNGWREVDAAPFVDEQTGQVLDFVQVPGPVRRGVWTRGIEELAPTPYAAALVAEHARTVYRRYNDDPEWAPFFAEMIAARDHHLERSGIATLETLQADYRFLRLGDLASLTFCGAEVHPMADEYGVEMRLDGRVLVVSPDPFGGREVPLEIPVRHLPAIAFLPVDTAQQAWEAAPVERLTGTAKGA